MFEKRITVLLGYSGCGKTRIALAGARALLRRREAVTLVDLDLANPSMYAPTLRRPLELRAATVIAAESDGLKQDASLLVARTRRVLDAGTGRVLLDVGADPVSLVALNKLADWIPPDDSERLFVVNFHRPFTEEVDQACEVATKLSRSVRLPLTGIVCNTHLMDETTPEIVLAGYHQAEEVARSLGVKVVGVIATERIGPRLDPAGMACPILDLEDGEQARHVGALSTEKELRAAAGKRGRR